jgi:signal transduction histidine kinase
MRQTITDKFAIKVRVGYTTALILLVISYLITLYANKQLINQRIWINQSVRAIDNLEKTLSGLKDAEAGLRGYIITKDTNTLLPYTNSFKIVYNSLNELKTFINIDEFQEQKLLKLEMLVRQKYARMDSSKSMLEANNFTINDEFMRAFYKGKYFMDSIRFVTNTMQIHERNLMITKNQKLEAKQRALKSIIISSLILAIMLIIFGFATFARENKAKLAAEKKSADYQQELKQHITDLNSANKKLVEIKGSEKFAATGRIARTIAHEVRNPLTNINLAVSQIKEDLTELDENSNMLFDMVTRNSERINLLISDLLNATRFEELRYEAVSINSLLDEALDTVKDRLELNQIQVQKKYSTDICDIKADAAKIKIAFVNIMVNAIEAMETGKGILQIATHAADNKCVVELKDNGAGMTEEQLNRLFEPYFTTKSNGNGLGLTNTQNIILNHDGAIYVVSTPGKGTCFTLIFDFAEKGK